MVVGFIFIKTDPKKEISTFRSLSRLKEIVDLTPLFGEYDLIARIESDSIEGLSIFVLERIRTVDGVMDTMTVPGVRI